ncbi:MAG TPA: histidine kinase [Draconibacterium sp.]|nr:histidine kinase [Draconibacterium sp.]
MIEKFLYDNRLLYRGSRHFLFFISMVLLFSFVLDSHHPNESFLSMFLTTFSNALFFFAYAYITIFLLIPEFLLKPKLGWFILLFVLIGFGLSALKLVASSTIFYASVSPENVPETGLMNLRFIIMNTKDMSFIVAVFCISKYVKDYFFTERIRKKLEVQTREAQNKLLSSQLDPHFLFNTINNLYALSLLDPEKTKNVVHQIKIVLSYMIDESQKELVDLTQEIQLVENYIKLEQLRYGQRLKINLETSIEDRSAKIPPMILFILVENCFKHGSSLDAGIPWIKINVVEKEGSIQLTARNSKPKALPGIESEQGHGKGLYNLKKRLNLLYPEDGFELNITNEEQEFKVELELKKKIEAAQRIYR